MKKIIFTLSVLFIFNCVQASSDQFSSRENNGVQQVFKLENGLVVSRWTYEGMAYVEVEKKKKEDAAGVNNSGSQFLRPRLWYKDEIRLTKESRFAKDLGISPSSEIVLSARASLDEFRQQLEKIGPIISGPKS